jgi:ABC-type sugar transport system ATPase subunit
MLVVMLQITDICKNFGDHAAVDHVNLTVAAGGSLALIGPSGCGKTTLLRLIAGLEIPSGGTIALSGKVLTGLPPAERGVQLAFQAPMLYPFMTVRRNLAFTRRRSGGVDEEEHDEICDALCIGGLLERRPQEISGGETQRVALARLLMRETRVALLDEPLSDVDPLLGRTIRQYVMERLRARGSLILYVTHDQEEAAIVGDRVAVMRSGRIHQVGTPRELYDGPTTDFVAEFLSTGGLPYFKALVRRGGQGTIVLSAFEGRTKIEIPASSELDKREGSEVKVVARGPILEFGERALAPGPRVHGRVKRFEAGFKRLKGLFETSEGHLWSVDLASETSKAVLEREEGFAGPAAMSLRGAQLLLFSGDGAAMGKYTMPS